MRLHLTVTVTSTKDTVKPRVNNRLLDGGVWTLLCCLWEGGAGEEKPPRACVFFGYACPTPTSMPPSPTSPLSLSPLVFNSASDLPS